MRRPSVFVVDDEPQICALLARILQRESYVVRSFTSGQEALDAVAAERPDVLVTDLMMPGMSGLELVRRARAFAPEMAAVLTTGYASINNVVEALRCGVNDFVTKPFSVAEIRAVVARVLETVRPAPEPAVPRESPAGGAVLARRFRDMNVVETIHGLLGDDPSSAELLPRCESVLAAALGARRAVLLAPTGRDATFEVRSATQGTWTPGLEVESGVVALVVASGAPGHVALAALGDAVLLLDDGATAAAPLCRRDPLGPDSGVLVVSRPASSPRFEAEDLRVLGVVANALGEVFRAVRTAERAEDGYFASLCDVVAATESRSPWFARHSERVRRLSVALGRRVTLPAAELEVLDMAARLLDLGRVEMPDDLLAKSGRPSDEEWTVLRRHATSADDVVRPLGRLRHVKPIIRHHHENWDGSGYPDGLSGDAIPYLACLVRITDAYAALTSPRAWRPANDASSAVRQIVDLSGRHFHPQLVAAFAEMQLAAEAAPERVQ